jgi:hypothetical protein
LGVVEDALDKLVDGLGLVTGRAVVGFELEGHEVYYTREVKGYY